MEGREGKARKTGNLSPKVDRLAPDSDSRFWGIEATAKCYSSRDFTLFYNVWSRMSAPNTDMIYDRPSRCWVSQALTVN